MLKRGFQFLVFFAFSLVSNLVMAGEYSELKFVHSNASIIQSATCHADTISCHIQGLNNIELVDIEHSDEDGFTVNGSNNGYFLSFVYRIVSDDNCASQGTEPDYHLLVSFLSPQLLSVAVMPTVIPPVSSHWTSSIAMNSRLSGWKESNTLYTHQHSRSI